MEVALYLADPAPETAGSVSADHTLSMSVSKRSSIRTIPVPSVADRRLPRMRVPAGSSLLILCLPLEWSFGFCDGDAARNSSRARGRQGAGSFPRAFREDSTNKKCGPGYSEARGAHSPVQVDRQEPLFCSVLFLGFLLFVAAEIASFVVVAEHIGFLWALVILLVVSAFGPFIVRRVGLGIVAHTQERLARGEVPTRDLLDGLVVLIGGVLICVPGFIGDAVGLLLMIGPVRHTVIRVTGHRLARRVRTVQTSRWRVVNVASQPVSERSPPTSAPPGPRLGHGDCTDS